MKLLTFKKNILVVLIIFQIFNLPAKAEIIEPRNEEKSFGDWKVYCEIDDMMNTAHCKIASKFYENTAVITIEPNAKFLGQLFVAIPQAKLGTFLQIRVDRNDIMISKNIGEKDFGLIPLDDQQKNMLYRQMRVGNFLYLRFNSKNLDEEITAKINLKDFRNALSYYASRLQNN